MEYGIQKAYGYMIYDILVWHNIHMHVLIRDMVLIFCINCSHSSNQKIKIWGGGTKYILINLVILEVN